MPEQVTILALMIHTHIRGTPTIGLIATVRGVLEKWQRHETTVYAVPVWHTIQKSLV